MEVNISIPKNVIFVNPCALPLFWDGVRWSTFNPATKITILPAKEKD